MRKWFRAKTLTELYTGRKGVRKIPKGTEVLILDDGICDWGFQIKLPQYKSLIGFYYKDKFEILEEVKKVDCF